MVSDRYLAGVLAAVVAVVCSACAAGAPARPAAVADLTYPAPSILSTVAAPPFAMTEYKLELSGSVQDNTGSRAVIAVHTHKEYPTAQLRILELDSGKHSLVVSAPVTVDVERFDIAASRISDRWIAWEEVSPGETERAPEQVYWRLYLAPMPPPGSVVTSHTLVDSGRLADRGRPLFAFRDDELVWMTNDRLAVDGVSQGRKGVVRRRDRSGVVADVLTLPTPIGAFNVSEGSVVVSYGLDRDGRREGVRVFGRDDRTRLVDVRPPDVGVLQHYPAYHAGDLAFRLCPESRPESAALVVRRRDGTMLNLGPEAMDGCFAGDYLFFDRDTSLSGSTGGKGDTFEIAGVSLDTREMFVLASSRPQGEGVWQTSLAASGYRDTLVLYNDRTGWLGGREQTLIRVYRGLGSSAGTSGDAR